MGQPDRHRIYNANHFNIQAGRSTPTGIRKNILSCFIKDIHTFFVATNQPCISSCPGSRKSCLGSRMKRNNRPRMPVNSPSVHPVTYNRFLACAGVKCFTTFAGTPTTTVFAGTSLVTTDPEPITAPSPTVTPGITFTPAPTHTLLPI